MPEPVISSTFRHSVIEIEAKAEGLASLTSSYSVLMRALMSKAIAGSQGCYWYRIRPILGVGGERSPIFITARYSALQQLHGGGS
jgi:hypothetical protein